jgi:hypothetical protein
MKQDVYSSQHKECLNICTVKSECRKSHAVKLANWVHADMFEEHTHTSALARTHILGASTESLMDSTTVKQCVGRTYREEWPILLLDCTPSNKIRSTNNLKQRD